LRSFQNSRRQYSRARTKIKNITQLKPQKNLKIK